MTVWLIGVAVCGAQKVGTIVQMDKGDDGLLSSARPKFINWSYNRLVVRTDLRHAFT
jgi:hypothetical protein